MAYVLINIVKEKGICKMIQEYKMEMEIYDNKIVIDGDTFADIMGSLKCWFFCVEKEFGFNDEEIKHNIELFIKYIPGFEIDEDYEYWIKYIKDLKNK